MARPWIWEGGTSPLRFRIEFNRAFSVFVSEFPEIAKEELGNAAWETTKKVAVKLATGMQDYFYPRGASGIGYTGQTSQSMWWRGGKGTNAPHSIWATIGLTRYPPSVPEEIGRNPYHYLVGVEYGTDPPTSWSAMATRRLFSWGQYRGFDDATIWKIIHHIRRYGTQAHHYFETGLEELLPEARNMMMDMMVDFVSRVSNRLGR